MSQSVLKATDWADEVEEEENEYLAAQQAAAKAPSSASAAAGGKAEAADGGAAADSADALADELASKADLASAPAVVEDEDDVIPDLVKQRGLLREGDLKITVEQADPNSPLHSATSFQELNLKDELLRAVFKMGFDKPSAIQGKVLPVLLNANAKEKHLIAQARSGTGKTAAFVLGMLQRIDIKQKYPQAVCICPTRELADQIREVVLQIGANLEGLDVLLAVKDEAVKIDAKRILAQLVVGTPGKILDIWKNNRRAFAKVQMLVLDEADKLIEQEGSGDGLKKQAEDVRFKAMPKTVSVALFSATFAQKVKGFAQKMAPDPCFKVWVEEQKLTVEKITQLYINVGNPDKKFEVLSDVYGFATVGQSIVFVHKRTTADELEVKMKAEGHSVAKLHGGHNVTQAERRKTMQDFRDGVYNVLIATNVVARGIDIEQVMLVVNYDLPLDGNNKPDANTYLHRIGRSGRFGRRGIAINFVVGDDDRKHLKHYEHVWKHEIKEIKQDDLENITPMLEELRQKDDAEAATARTAFLEGQKGAKDQLAALDK